MKNFILALIPKLTTKAAITAVSCVVAGATVSATTTAVVYNNKVAQYEKTIERLEAEGSSSVEGRDSSAPTEARVVDGKLEIWDGTMWVSYGPVDAVAASDPFYENSEKKDETERSVAERKLESLGLKVDDDGEIVPIDPDNGATVSKTSDGIMVLVGSASANGAGKSVASSKTSANTKGSNNPAPVVSNLTGVAGERTADPNLSALPADTVTKTTWTSQPSSGGGGGGGGNDWYDSGSSGGSSGSSSGGSASVAAPSQPASAPVVVETPSGGGDSGGGGGDSGGGGGDSGGGGGDSGGGGDDGGGDDGGGDGDDFSEDVK